jgi:CRISPR-associated endonuclease/helicase Cas3
VVEVSLDVDFDVLYSDPAPLEALFQRFGRVNRARRYSEREVVVMTEIPEGSPVYNRLLVEKSIASLAAIKDQLIDEAELQALLDSVYAGSIGEWWQKEVQQAMAEFKTRVLTSLYPFESDERLEESFAAMFDGEEVLPHALLEEYRKLAEEDPLLASALLVSVSHNQFARLMREKQLSKLDRHTFIAHVPYSNAAGLQLTKEALNLSI